MATKKKPVAKKLSAKKQAALAERNRLLRVRIGTVLFLFLSVVFLSLAIVLYT